MRWQNSKVIYWSKALTPIATGIGSALVGLPALFVFGLYRGDAGLWQVPVAAVLAACFFACFLYLTRRSLLYFVETDGQSWIRKRGWGYDVTITRTDSRNIALSSNELVIESSNARLFVDRGCAGFDQLCLLAQRWSQ